MKNHTAGAATKKKLLLATIQTIAIAILIVIAGWYLSVKVDFPDFSRLVRSWSFVLATLLTVLSFIAQGVLITAVMRRHGHRLQAIDAFLVTMSSSFLNYIPGKPGLALKIGYICTRLKIRAPQAIGHLAFAQLLLIGSAGFVGLACMMLTSDMQTRSTLLLGLVFFGLLCLAVMIIFYDRFRTLRGPVERFLSRIRFRSSSDSTRLNRSLLPTLGVANLAIVVVLLGAVRLYTISSLAGLHISPFLAFLLQATAVCSVVFAVLPGNLGLREGAIIGAGVALGLPAEPLVLLAFMDRMAVLGVVFSLGPLSVIVLWRRMKLQKRKERRGHA